MGINAKNADYESQLAVRITRERGDRERAVRERVRKGEVTLDWYLVKHKGYREEHLARIRPRFHKAIFGH